MARRSAVARLPIANARAWCVACAVACLAVTGAAVAQNASSGWSPTIPKTWDEDALRSMDRKPEHTFSQEMIALILFDTAPNLPGTPAFDPTKPVSPGFFAGWQTVSHTVSLTAADQIASSGTNRFYKTNGDVYRSGCSTATGQRF